MKAEQYTKIFGPECFPTQYLNALEFEGDDVKSGSLLVEGKTFEIKSFIPRFVPSENYASSFGYQWGRFKRTQLDSQTGKSVSRQRFYTFTKWTPEELKGKRILEVGCGSGRFTEIMLDAGADLVSVDYSTAAEINYQNNRCDRLFVAQADLFQLPFKRGSFDYVFCFGVLQHTPDPIKAFKTISGFLKPAGKISIDNYIKRLLSPFSTPKYVWRPITARMNPEKLLRIIKFYVPLYLPFDTMLRRIPKVGQRILALIPIPCWNYIHMGLGAEQRKEWAILDTFDALSAAYDIPLEIEDFKQACAELPFSAYEVFYGSNGVVTNAQLRDGL